ncbi:MAG TPA: TetR family transcriptional regulator [Polyangiales bacterium]|nr:TetR family transcriptional regulator [Polyangiales bacterium]
MSGRNITGTPQPLSSLAVRSLGRSVTWGRGDKQVVVEGGPSDVRLRAVFRTNLQKQGEKERVRAALLRAALQLGAAHGFASLGLREVARAAGIAPTSFYRHFADMQELGSALSTELVGQTIAEVCDAIGAPTNALVEVLWDSMFAACERDPELTRFFLAERAGASPQLRASLQGQLSVLAEALRAAAHSTTASAADAAVVLLVDACARALDETPEQRAALRGGCTWAISRLLAAESSKVDP